MIKIDRQKVKSSSEQVRNSIGRICEAGDRDPDSITLIAVTKGFPPGIFKVASDQGFDHVGENRVREGVRRKQEAGDVAETLNWHMIGHVQSNKVKHLLNEFCLLHSLDRPSLLNELQKRLDRNGLSQDVLLQVNHSGEESKHGVEPDRAEELLTSILEASRLTIRGLMTMAPRTDDESVQRETFAACRRLRDELEETYDISLPELSMGMTNDYPAALREGSTMLRIGRGFFGERPD